MNHTVTIIYGKEQASNLLAGGELSADELKTNQRSYSFSTKKELASFIHGLNEAVGWLDFAIADNTRPSGSFKLQ
jgi:hypothetical protein